MACLSYLPKQYYWIFHLYSHICKACARTHKPSQFPPAFLAAWGSPRPISFPQHIPPVWNLLVCNRLVLRRIAQSEHYQSFLNYTSTLYIPCEGTRLVCICLTRLKKREVMVSFRVPILSMQGTTLCIQCS